MNNIKETLIISTYLYDDTKREYVLIDDFDEKLDDSNYLDGYIKLKIGKITLSDEQLYDDIDTLWLYWINGIKSIIKNESFKCYYPDQPVKIEIIPIDKNTLKVCVKEQCTSVNKDQFIKSMSSNIKYRTLII